MKNDRVKKLAEKCQRLPFEKREIREALEPWRTIEIQTDRGIPAGPYLYQMRQDGENKWIFLAHAQKPQNPDSVLEERLRICVPGCWKAFSYDALTGKKQEVPVSYKNGKTLWSEVSYAQDSFLYCLQPGTSGFTRTEKTVGELHPIRMPETVQAELKEPNVLVLDMEEYRLDDGDWREKEEILRLDNVLRKELGYPLRADAYA